MIKQWQLSDIGTCNHLGSWFNPFYLFTDPYQNCRSLLVGFLKQKQKKILYSKRRKKEPKVEKIEQIPVEIGQKF